MNNNILNFKKINDILNNGKTELNNINVENQIKLLKKDLPNEKLQKKHLTNLEKYNKRIEKIQIQKIIDHSKKVEANHQREQRIKTQVEIAKYLEIRKNFDKIKRIKNKEDKSQKLLTELKNLKLYKKQNRDIERYFEKVKYQNETLMENQMLIDECYNKFSSSINSTSENEDKIEDELLIEIPEEEEEHEEECILVTNHESVKNV